MEYINGSDIVLSCSFGDKGLTIYFDSLSSHVLTWWSTVPSHLCAQGVRIGVRSVHIVQRLFDGFLSKALVNMGWFTWYLFATIVPTTFLCHLRNKLLILSDWLLLHSLHHYWSWSLSFFSWTVLRRYFKFFNMRCISFYDFSSIVQQKSKEKTLTWALQGCVWCMKFSVGNNYMFKIMECIGKKVLE